MDKRLFSSFERGAEDTRLGRLQGNQRVNPKPQRAIYECPWSRLLLYSSRRRPGALFDLFTLVACPLRKPGTSPAKGQTAKRTVISMCQTQSRLSDIPKSRGSFRHCPKASRLRVIQCFLPWNRKRTAQGSLESVRWAASLRETFHMLCSRLRKAWRLTCLLCLMIHPQT